MNKRTDSQENEMQNMTIDQAEARYDETSEALRNAAAGSERDAALVAFENAIETLRAVRGAAVIW